MDLILMIVVVSNLILIYLTWFVSNDFIKVNKYKNHKLYLYSFSNGNAITYCILSLPVISITNLSIPIPHPAVGGRPYSKASIN